MSDVATETAPGSESARAASNPGAVRASQRVIARLSEGLEEALE